MYQMLCAVLLLGLTGSGAMRADSVNLKLDEEKTSFPRFHPTMRIEDDTIHWVVASSKPRAQWVQVILPQMPRQSLAFRSELTLELAYREAASEIHGAMLIRIRGPQRDWPITIVLWRSLEPGSRGFALHPGDRIYIYPLLHPAAAMDTTDLVKAEY